MTGGLNQEAFLTLHTFCYYHKHRTHSHENVLGILYAPSLKALPYVAMDEIESRNFPRKL